MPDLFAHPNPLLLNPLFTLHLGGLSSSMCVRNFPRCAAFGVLIATQPREGVLDVQVAPVIDEAMTVMSEGHFAARRATMLKLIGRESAMIAEQPSKDPTLETRELPSGAAR